MAVNKILTGSGSEVSKQSWFNIRELELSFQEWIFVQQINLVEEPGVKMVRFVILLKITRTHKIIPYHL